MEFAALISSDGTLRYGAGPTLESMKRFVEDAIRYCKDINHFKARIVDSDLNELYVWNGVEAKS